MTLVKSRDPSGVLCARLPIHKNRLFRNNKNRSFSLRVGSDRRLLSVHQELSIRALWIIFFRTQGDQTVTLEKIRGPSDDLCARLPMYKVMVTRSGKTTGSVVLGAI